MKKKGHVGPTYRKKKDTKQNEVDGERTEVFGGERKKNF